MGLSGAIGFEIFVLLDYAYFHLAGTHIILSLLIAALINLLIMFSYCELSAAMPEVGGEYTYVKAAYGGFIAFTSGCFRWFASVFGAALAATSFTLQFAYLFSIFAPMFHDFILFHIPLIAMVVVMVFVALEVKGVKKMGALMIVVFIVIFAIFIAGGLLRGLTSVEILPKNPLEGLPGVFAATVYMFPMFFGMRALIAGAALVKQPEKNIAKGIILSALLIIPVYLGIAYVAAGVISPEETSPSAPFLNFAAQQIMGVPGGVLFAIAGMVASLSALSTSLSVQSSIARGMSRDGYLPEVLLSIHRRFGTPYIAIIAGSFFVMLFSAIGTAEFLGYAASFGSLLVFAMVNLSLLELRKKKPYMERPFKTPLYPLTPIAGFVMPVVLLAFPIFLRDVEAVGALSSGIVLTALVLMTYYLRMLGRLRLQIAMGGAGLGIGVSLMLLTYLTEACFILPVFSHTANYILFFVGVILVMTGILYVATRG